MIKEKEIDLEKKYIIEGDMNFRPSNSPVLPSENFARGGEGPEDVEKVCLLFCSFKIYIKISVFFSLAEAFSWSQLSWVQDYLGIGNLEKIWGQSVKP